MPASIQSIRIGNLADLRALQLREQRLLRALIETARAQDRVLTLLLCQEQTGRIVPLRGGRDLPEAA